MTQLSLLHGFASTRAGTVAPLLPLAREAPLERDATCRRCSLHREARTVCMPWSGDPGGLLVIGEGPGRDEDAAGRPFVGRSGQHLRPIVAKNWAGPVAYANAEGCYPGSADVGAREVAACRGYVRGTIDAVRPTRVVCLGGWAAASVTGAYLPPLSTRRSYALLDGIPVFFVMHPAAGLRNQHMDRAFTADLRWALTVPDPPKADATWEVPSKEAAIEALRAYRAQRCRVAFDCEAADDHPNRDPHKVPSPWSDGFRVLCVALTGDGSRSIVLSEELLADAEVLGALRDLMQDVAVPKCGQVIKYDVLCLLTLGIRVRGIDGDTRAARRLLESEADSDLDTMSWQVGLGGFKTESTRALGKGAGRRGFDELDLPVLWGRCAGDTAATWRLDAVLTARLAAAPRLAATYQRVVLPVTDALARVEEWGVAVSVPAARAFGEMLKGQIATIDEAIVADPDVRAFAARYGKPPDLDSPKQLAVFLYDHLGLHPPRITDKGHRSTDEESLSALSGPFVEKLLKRRELSKLKSTYADAMILHVRSDGRAHTTYNPDRARTGRGSSEDPNLQNIPRAKTPLGKMARNIFVAPDGYLLIECDYSQIELRIAAYLSNDLVLIEDFRRGADIHRLAASLAFGVPIDQVTSKQRSDAKSVAVFGTLYGQSDETMAANLNLSVAKVHGIRQAVWGKYAALARWCEAQRALVRAHGEVWVETLPGCWRRRQLWDAGSQDPKRRSHAERQAVNTPIQAKANEYTYVSLVEIVRWIDDEGVPAKVVLTVHDSIVLEVRKDARARVLREVPRIMCGWGGMGGVPVKVDVSEGESWGSMEDVPLAA